MKYYSYGNYYRSRNNFSPKTNRLVGRLTRLFLCLTIFYISYNIWGIQVIDEIWFWMIETIAFLSTGYLLRLINFWVY